jgi:hypothetical protein
MVYEGLILSVNGGEALKITSLMPVDRKTAQNMPQIEHR